MGSTTSWSYKVTLAPRASNVGVARALVRDCLVEHNLSFLVDDVRLVTSEFATNAVVHAGTGFKLRLVGSGEHVWLTVSHHARRAPVAASTSFMNSKSRGLTLVGSYASDWGVTNGKRNAKSVWALFDIDT